MQSERDGLAGRLASLEEMVATHSAFDEGVRALLAGPDGIEVLGVVADAVETDSGYERAVEAFLGDRLQAILTADAAGALRGIRYLQESGAGRGAFLPLASARTKADCVALRDVAGAGAASARAARRRLSRDRAARRGHPAPRFRKRWSSIRWRMRSRSSRSQGPVACVTLAGETLRGSMVEGGRGVKGLLAPRREIREISVRQEQVEAAPARRARARAGGLHARGSGLRGGRAALEERIHAAEKDLVALRHDLAAAEEEMARLQRKEAVLDTERGQAEQERGAAAVRLAEIEQALATAERDRDEGSRRLAALTTAVAEARAASEAAQVRTSEAKSVLAALRERAAATEAECRRLEQDHRDLHGAHRRRRAAGGGDGRRAAKSCARRWRTRSACSRRRWARASAWAAKRRWPRTACATCATSWRAARPGSRSAAASATCCATRWASWRWRRRARDRTSTTSGRECHQAVAMMAAEAAALITEEDRAQDLSGLEVQVQEMRERLDRMGPVNVLAVEQSQELEERSTFLTAQRQDLLDSIAELDQAIKKIDRASRERFQEAFQVINQHFGEIFRQLFGGGTAGLSLIDEEDLLESGIDVLAQPPGKRLQNVMLLSGGEKALTAISLLFAIFQYKPSPFCILDEVDAPLDDANVGRFVRMLEGLKEQTQFVLITHSRKTMEIADQLYGVTMEEPGVSKLVSVRLS